MENQGYEEDQARRDRNSSPNAYKITHRELRTEFQIESTITEESNFPADSLVHPDGHVYEDIASSTEEGPRKFNDSSYEPTINVPSTNEVETVENEDILANKSSIEPRTSDRAQLAMEKIARDLLTRKSTYHVTPSNTFQRNLTLPFRRAIAPNPEISNSSVRVTSKEKSARLDDDNSNDHSNLSNLLVDKITGERNDETAELEHRESSRDVRPSRRRKKKDCKHCRSKVNTADFSHETTLVLQDAKNGEDFVERADRKKTVGEETFDYGAANGEMILTVRDVRSFPVYHMSSTNAVDTRSSITACKNTSAVFSISDGVRCLPPSTMKFIEYEKDNVGTAKQFVPVAESNEDKALITPQKARYGMRVNSIYSQEQWYAKEGPIFYTDIKEQSAFQRAYSLPIQAQSTTSPASQNRVNLRRSVRGEPPPQPAKLRKHRHGWTLHLARPLEGSPGCTRSLVLLLVLVLALLGIGAIALYIVFEPEKLQIIQQYLRSSTGNSSISEAPNAIGSSVHQNGSFTRVDGNQTTATSSLPSTTSSSASSTATRMALVMGVLLNGIPSPPVEQSSTLPEVVETTIIPMGLEMGEVTLNSTRYCDDCLKEEVCVALVDEDVPICRTGVDPQDPTGCSGLCVINRQRCHRLDVDAFRCVEVEHYCLDDEWTCSNTLCIPLTKHCDGHMNCYDHSDEYNCVCDLETHFQCGNGTSCLPLERRCDGKIDCWDATDEINCTLGRNLGWSCPLESEFTCSNGECILKTRFCDGLADCTDGSDEPHGCKGRCNKHEFTCQNSRCIAKGMKCNGVDDCGDGTDERHCKDRLT